MSIHLSVSSQLLSDQIHLNHWSHQWPSLLTELTDLHWLTLTGQQVPSMTDRWLTRDYIHWVTPEGPVTTFIEWHLTDQWWPLLTYHWLTIDYLHWLTPDWSVSSFIDWPVTTFTDWPLIDQGLPSLTDQPFPSLTDQRIWLCVTVVRLSVSWCISVCNRVSQCI